ncbi:hypothetical protein BY996DRAFT_6818162 [Phakopsora pachyrhizi]|uniref:Uncharacterized protein n=1 Tax=Phakopsora pachyrhizi TaxID=170000 RepID=A0AAV0AKA4_PHAPC|nr:hypothetical protein BY996DRAFT_6818162 [Phakopsora pachyrhizi]CAH7668348.1 hypothetical protein PPACK8108_LOCUS2846 [Phakopsora pachyrhizi]
MFAGIDSESVFSVESSPRLCRSKSAVVPATRSSSSKHHEGHHRHRSNACNFDIHNPFIDPKEIARRESMREEEFGWSGSAAGIRGRDDRQIERDAEYERQMEERRRLRHERKLARQQRKHDHGREKLPTPSPGKTRSSNSNDPPSYEKVKASTSKAHRRPVFAPTEQDLEHINSQEVSPTNTSHIKPQKANGTTTAVSNKAENLNRGKSLRDKFGAALGRWNSISRSKSMVRSKSVGALDATHTYKPEDQQLHFPQVEPRKEGIIRRLSRKITIEDQERRRKEREMVYAGKKNSIAFALNSCVLFKKS